MSVVSPVPVHPASDATSSAPDAFSIRRLARFIRGIPRQCAKLLARVKKRFDIHVQNFLCAVIGTPDERLGETVSAVVVNEEKMTTDNVESHCRERLTDNKSPCRIEFVDDLPKTSTRKIDKVSVREEF